MPCSDIVFFFFKQKTAYEMRISDWSSDVCSSDLAGGHVSQRELYALKLEDVPPELPPLVRVAQRFLERTLGKPQRKRRQPDTPGVERPHEVREPFPLDRKSVV